MNRRTQILAVGALSVFLTSAVNAADVSVRHGYVGHAVPGFGHASSNLGYSNELRQPQHGYADYELAAPAYRHGLVPYGHVNNPGYAAHVYGAGGQGGFGYHSFGHSGAVYSSAPYRGLRIGH